MNSTHNIIDTKQIAVRQHTLVISLVNDVRSVKLTYDAIINGVREMALPPQEICSVSKPEIVAQFGRVALVASDLIAVNSAITALKRNPAYVAYEDSLMAGISANLAHAEHVRKIDNNR